MAEELLGAAAVAKILRKEARREGGQITAPKPSVEDVKTLVSYLEGGVRSMAGVEEPNLPEGWHGGFMPLSGSQARIMLHLARTWLDWEA